MLKPKSRWIVKKSDQSKTESLAKDLNISSLTASLLVNRGLDTVEDARYFLFGQKNEFHDPFLLKDMDKTVARINKAVETQEPVLVFGDYDADGVSSTTVMMKALTEIGANADYYIPNRFTEGYGPNEKAFRKAAESGIGLIITVDTGISALHEANVARDLGIDLIITDHHEPGPVLPDAFAIIHPKLEDSVYPFKDLAGVGVALKVAHALLGRLPEHLLEFAAIGTIADLVPLLGENRLIALSGIAQMKASQTPGLHALLKLAKTEKSAINEETIGFLIGPRVNAAGRLGSADPAVQLMMTSDPEEAMMLAEEIDSINKERQNIVAEIAREAIDEVEKNYPVEDNRVLIVGKEGWNAGVIGIVASKLVEKYYRPAIVLSFDKEKGLAKGSARSIAGFDLFKNLSTCRNILPHFGGHPMAAGMTLELDHVEELRTRLNELAKEQLTEEDLIPVSHIDAKIAINDIDIESIIELGLLSPYGVSNPKPRVLIEEANISTLRKIGADQSHLKLSLEEAGTTIDGIGFGFGHLHDHISPSSKLSIIGELSINEWNNIKKPQIFLRDVAVNSWQLFDFRGLKRIEKLPEMISGDNIKWILFNPELKDKFSAILGDSLLLVPSVEEAAKLDIDLSYTVLLDLPPTKEILENLFSGKKPGRIYVHFYKENSDFFTTMPTREHFKWYYAFLSKRGSFDLKRYGDELAKHKGWTKETVDFMSQVFFELEFVKINNGFISLEKNVPKRDLSESKTYQHKVQAFTLENELLYSSYEQLKAWFDQYIQESVKNEEAIIQWI
ncbi:single-stranded-DNA-specific exonuclease RecJ [Mesobacillus subterraneus]|uniref:single-stranded-DNA-specific exonuclease RecJ n=1 Tax=Mesobacillus subterraneus TaxID=285983 RepID=UPI00203B8394|nr:single-stranded-DNA-specific exonuclease RecJ [Mesobacillus subterraneus]MCM3663877.1 single-stranded-DNA-specific exonuclease RecJ [Mesobacillus subterraneus]MCM3683637.1 single-stranded-DNA-specific exonuclease RecJ [Mesobacillus subterraneus]